MILGRSNVQIRDARLYSVTILNSYLLARHRVWEFPKPGCGPFHTTPNCIRVCYLRQPDADPYSLDFSDSPIRKFMKSEFLGMYASFDFA